MAGRLGTLVVCVIALAVTAGDASAAGTNLLQNGAFERAGGFGTLTGWRGVGAGIALRTDGIGGGHAALVVRVRGQRTYGIATRPNPVTTVAGTLYRASGSVRSGRPGRRVCVRMIEFNPAGATAGRASRCATARVRWHGVPRVSYRAKHTGDRLSYRVMQTTRARRGDSFQVDDLVLSAPVADTTAPTAPTGLTATATSPSKVALAWHAASDNVAVKGYTVYRGGTEVATVAGSTLTYTDTGLRAGHTYTYAVDAFDAAGNRSARSASASATTHAPSGGGGGGGTGPAAPVVVIMMENKRYGDIVGNSNAPYIQSLIRQGTLYTSYEAGPGSLPDYLANTAGVWTTAAAKSSDNIFHQLQVAGVRWGEYEESMPRACFTASGSAPYKKQHNPAVFYSDITSSPAACANVLPYSDFDPAHPRAFSYVVPNLNDDMHDGASQNAEIAAGDAWLAANVPAMLNGGAEVILTWDEGIRSDERVATIAVGGGAGAGVTDGHAYTHPGLLAGLEDAWGLPRLHDAQTADPFPIR
jgi:phosphatidylinositol-3-phosphatase